MECGICSELFSAEAPRRPKALPCGHTFCEDCLRQLPAKRCPTDNKRFRSVENLPENLLVIQLQQQLQRVQQQLQQVQQASGHRLWCRDCNKEADDACVDEHSVCGLRRARADRAAPRLAALEADEAALRGLRAELDGAADCLDAELARCRGRLVDGLCALNQTRQQLQGATEADEAAFQKALEVSEAAGQDGLSKDAALLLPVLCDAGSACSVSLQGPDGGSWTASVAHSQRPAARLLLCQLLCDAELHRQSHDHQQANLNGQHQVQPDEARPRWEEKTNAVELDCEAMARRLREGSRVARGRDWPAGSTADGQPAGPGTVTLAVKGGSRVLVAWDRGGSGSHCMGPERPGKDPVYELKLLPQSCNYRRVAGIKHDDPAFINLHQLSNCLDVRKKTEVLNSLDKVLALVDLRCDISPTWSMEVLRRVSPRLKGLRLLQPDAAHLRIAQGMPNLTTLFLSPVDKEVLQIALSMPGLLHLEAHCPFKAPLPGALQPPLEPSRLLSLRLGVYPLRAAMALVRAHAATLELLCLVAATTEPYGCPDLAAELRRCGLQKITKLCLWRQSDIEFCRHDVPSCREQRVLLFDMFVDTGLTVEIACNYCA